MREEGCSLERQTHRHELDIYDYEQSGRSLSIGSKIALTFISSIEFNFLKQSVTLHTANLLINALVKIFKSVMTAQ